MSNLDAQFAATYEHAHHLNGGVMATEPRSQAQVPSIESEFRDDWAVLATFRLAVDDVLKALARISVVRDERAELRFAGGVLLIRKYSDTLTCQVAVRLTECIGEPFGFSISDEELSELDDIRGELKVQVNGCVTEHEVLFSGTRDDSTELEFAIRRDSLLENDTNSLSDGRLLPGVVLTEALRTIQPFRPRGEREDWHSYERTRLLKMTRHGLGCNSPGSQCVFFDAAELLDTPWVMPVEILPKARKFVHQFESFSVSVEDAFTRISDGNGSFVAWETPADTDVKFNYHKLDSDQFVAHVSAKDTERALKHVKSMVTDPEAVVVLGVSQDVECLWFETMVDGTAVKSPSAAARVERNTLDVEVAARFTLDSLQKVFCGTRGPSLELRLYRGQVSERRPVIWLLRSIESYALDGSKETSGTKCSGEPIQCTVTRFAPSVRQGHARTSREQARLLRSAP